MNSNHSRRLSTVFGAVGVTAILLAACSSSRSSTASTTSGGSTVPTSSAPATTAPATVPPSTAAPATTTTVPTDLTVLRSDGVGSGAGALDFGDRAGDVITALTAAFGAPDSDESESYPTPDGSGQYLNSFGDVRFISPSGRTVCYLVGLCAYFGGSDPASLSFVGWSYADNPAASGLHTPSGVTMGARWSDFPAIMLHSGGCYTFGTGVIEGIDLGLQSSGVPFTEIDGGGNWVTNVPAAADVTVIHMSAGEMPVFLAGDC